MARKRGERRAAEEAARSRIAGMVTFVGDIGEAAATRSAARASVQETRDRANQLLEDARREGDRLVSEAQQRVTDADRRYSDAFDRAIEEGWAVRLLTDPGYAAPHRRGRRLRTPTSDGSAGVAASESAVALSDRRTW